GEPSIQLQHQFQSLSSSNSAAIFVSELLEGQQVAYEKSLGSSRFLKTIKARHSVDGTQLVVKAFLKPLVDESQDTKAAQPLSLKQTIRAINAEAEILGLIPNAFPYHKVVETAKAGYMIRQYLYSNLYDRISSAFQILLGLSQAHANNIYHGDIKCENILVTSWNWAYLSDFSGYKPVYLPEDNPADFTFFFDSSSRQTLFHIKRAELTPEMDIFAVGCTIAEMFLEGTPLFTLSQLLRYRRGEYDPRVVLEKIEDVHVKNMLLSMISMDPSKRKTVDSYLNEFLVHDEQQGDHSFPIGTDAKIEKIYNEFWRVAEAAGIPNLWVAAGVEDVEISETNKPKTVALSSVGRMHLLPMKLNIPNFTACSSEIEVKRHVVSDVCLILTTIVCTTLRNTHYPSLDRVIPYLVQLLQDENALVRATAIKVMTQLLSMVDTITTADVNIFQEYILPVLKTLSADPEVIVRVTYAGCIASIAETALRFLEIAQLFQQNFTATTDNDDGTLNQQSYDTALHELHESIQEEVVIFLSDSDVHVKRALLGDMARLCIFFGRQRANDVLLGHMITYLNDRDWRLRSSFFESIVGVGTFVGGRSLEDYILPLIVQSLTDAEECVVEKVVGSLTSLVELGLFTKGKVKELVATVMPLLCHPSPWIRYGTIAFISAASKKLPLIDLRCILYPQLKPYLKCDISDVTEVNLLFNLKTPLSRVLYDQALLLASKTPVVPYKKERTVDVLSLESENDFGNETTEMILRLREFGMTDEDKEKLFSLKYYISKSTQRRMGTNLAEIDERSLRKMPVAPHTVFLSPPKYINPNVSTSESVSSSHLLLAPRTRNASEPLTIRSLAASPEPHILPGRVVSGASSDVGSVYNAALSTSPLKQRGPLRVPTRPSSILSEGGRSMTPPVARYTETEFSTGSDEGRQGRAAPSVGYAASSIPRGPGSRAGGLRKEASVAGESGGPVGPPVIMGITSSGIDGRDENVKLLLEAKRLELFPPPIFEFGARVNTPSTKNRRANATGGSDLKSWRPKGILAAHLTEHRASVNQICVSPDHSFFASASDDGTIKIWDCKRLEKNVTNKPRLTYSAQGGKIKSMTFLNNYHIIASASDNGSIHISRVEYMSANSISSNPKYNGIDTVKSAEVAGKDRPILLNHYESDQTSLLVYATSHGSICGLDLRSMKPAWTYESPPHLGITTAFTMDPRNSWILTGSHRGVFSLWDIRFGLRVKTWAHPSGMPIHKIVRTSLGSQHSSRRATQSLGLSSPLSNSTSFSSKNVLASIGGTTSEMGLWDIEAGECQEVWCAFGGTGNSALLRNPPTTSTNSDSMAADMQRLYGKGLKAVAPPLASNFLAPIAKKVTMEPPGQTEASLKSIFTAGEVPYILTAGTDRKIRFWDLGNVGQSYVVSGLEPFDSKPRYSSHPYKDLAFNIEYTPPPAANTAPPRPSFHTNTSGSFQNQQQVGGGVLPQSDQQPMASPSIINHLDAINDMAVTQVPYPMIISASRDGVIKIFA
ncbi:WD40 repeat-like protein, partial [Rhizoclosmatium globosum]